MLTLRDFTAHADRDDGGARYRALAAMGVREVTDDFNCSAGLCW